MIFGMMPRNYRITCWQELIPESINMTIEKLLSLCAAFLGFIASIFFIFGSLKMTGKGIKQIACTYWNFNKYVAKALISQKVEYILGALFLGLSFSVQMATYLLPRELLQTNLSFSKTSSGLFFSLALLGVGLACRFRVWLLKYTTRQVTTEQKKEEREYRRSKKSPKK